MSKIDFNFLDEKERYENRQKIACAVQEKVKKYFSNIQLIEAIKNKKAIKNDDFFVMDYTPKKGELYDIKELSVNPYIEINKVSSYESSEIIKAIIVGSSIGLCNEILKFFLSSKCSKIHSANVECEVDDKLGKNGRFVIKPSYGYKVSIIIRKEFDKKI